MKKFILAASLGVITILASNPAIAITTQATNGPFTQNLFFGVQAAAQVKALQKLLTAQGVYSGPITGNFLNLTMQGVKQFQIINNVTPSTGYFGPLTRAKANAIALAETPELAVAPTTSITTTTSYLASAPSRDLLAYLRFELSGMFQTVENLGARFFGSSPSPSAPSVSVSPVPATAKAAGAPLDTSTSGGGTATVSTQTSITPPATSATSTTTIVPIPATTTLTLNISIVGGTAHANNFSITITDKAVSLIIFSGAASSAGQQFTLTQGHSYTVTEATTANSANYSISLSAGCAGVVTANADSCTITNTYNPPGSSESSGSGSGSGSSGTLGSGSAPSSTPVAQSGMLWGAYVGDIDATPSLVSSFTSLAGGSPSIIASFTDLSSGDFPSDEKATVGAQGKTLLLFLEPQYSFDQINSGAEDSILQQYAAAAATYGDPIILAPFDEFNLNENPWGYSIDGNTPTKFIQAWQHVHSFFANDPNVKFALVYNNVPEPADNVNTYAAYYPGNAYVDYVAVDGFNFGMTSANSQTFEQIFNPIMPTLESFNKPILFTSIGSLEFPGKAQWISHGLGTYIEEYPNIAGWVYFNYDDTSAGQNWRVDTDPASLVAFQTVIP